MVSSVWTSGFVTIPTPQLSTETLPVETGRGNFIQKIWKFGRHWRLVRATAEFKKEFLHKMRSLDFVPADWTHVRKGSFHRQYGHKKPLQWPITQQTYGHARFVLKQTWNPSYHFSLDCVYQISFWGGLWESLEVIVHFACLIIQFCVHPIFFTNTSKCISHLSYTCSLPRPVMWSL